MHIVSFPNIVISPRPTITPFHFFRGPGDSNSSLGIYDRGVRFAELSATLDIGRLRAHLDPYDIRKFLEDLSYRGG